jgi:hypothetical protein
MAVLSFENMSGDPEQEYFVSAVGYLMGVRPWHGVWAFGGGYPMLSGNIMDITSEKMGLEGYTTTPVNNDGDLIKALRDISKRSRLDVMAGTPLLYLLISRMAYEPEFYESLAVDRLREWYGVPLAIGRHVARLYLKLYLHGIDTANLKSIINNVQVGISFSEPMDHYLYQLRKDYPAMQFHDFLGSTEVRRSLIVIPFAVSKSPTCMSMPPTGASGRMWWLCPRPQARVMRSPVISRIGPSECEQ